MIAKSKSRTKGLTASNTRTLAVVLLLGPLAGLVSGCTSTTDLLGGDKVDRSISTGSIPTKAKSGEAVSDEVTVRNAVTSADLAAVGTKPLPWANSVTGSAGVVSTIREARSEGQVCRVFTTTRHSYQGIAMFSGQACRGDSGDWMLTAFDQQ